MLRDPVYLRPAALLCYACGMDEDEPFDCRRKAEAAMKMAAAASGPERQQWVQVARIWHALDRKGETPTVAKV